jgi:flagellar basal-body rod protein FlgC
MSMLKVFDIAGSAVSAQSQRLNVVASNLANAESVAGPDSEAYRARHVVFSAVPKNAGTAEVRVTGIVTDQTPGRRTFDPKHPMADAEGYVTASNVNVVEQMVDMISASRAYQTNLEIMNTAKALALKTLTLGT